MVTLLRRRIHWTTLNLAAGPGGAADVELPGGDRSTFRWICRLNGIFGPNDVLVSTREVWYLHWEGSIIEHFSSEVALRLFIIRFVYSIEEPNLIPSELLYDAGLWYTTGDWVDTFCCQDQNDEIALFRGGFPGKIPENRFLRLPEKGQANHHHHERSASREPISPRGALSRFVTVVPSYSKRPPKPEVPDEECVFVIPVGIPA